MCQGNILRLKMSLLIQKVSILILVDVSRQLTKAYIPEVENFRFNPNSSGCVKATNALSPNSIVVVTFQS